MEAPAPHRGKLLQERRRNYFSPYLIAFDIMAAVFFAGAVLVSPILWRNK
jgi:hypothetical protein